MTTTTPQEVKAGIRVVKAVAEAIREAGRIPSGHLYALLCGVTDLAGYEQIIGILVNAGLVRKAGHELVWVG